MMAEKNSPPVGKKTDLFEIADIWAMLLPIPFWIIVFYFGLLEKLFPAYSARDLVSYMFIISCLACVLAGAVVLICLHIIHEKFEKGRYQSNDPLQKTPPLASRWRKVFVDSLNSLPTKAFRRFLSGKYFLPRNISPEPYFMRVSTEFQINPHTYRQRLAPLDHFLFEYMANKSYGKLSVAVIASISVLIVAAAATSIIIGLIMVVRYLPAYPTHHA